MKRIFAILPAVLLCAVFAGCGKTEAPTVPALSESSTESSKLDSAPSESGRLDSAPQNTSEDTMYIIIGDSTLTVKMADNSSAKALLALLKDGDITVDAHDYGSFEKVGPLGTELPVNDEQITTEPGDVILYQGDQITVYYDTNSWNFTRLGKVQDVTAGELKAILGDGDVTMVLSLNAPGGTASNTKLAIRSGGAAGSSDSAVYETYSSPNPA